VQKRQQLRDKAQQQVLQPSLQDKAVLANYKNDLSRDFTKTVEPSMEWFRDKKRELQAELGERWAEGLYAPGCQEEDREVKRHRSVSARSTSNAL
jgi:hypothetical protein